MSQFRPPSQPGWGQPEPGQEPFPQWQPPQQPFYPQPGQYRPQSLQVPQPQQQWQQLPTTPIQPAPRPPQKSNKPLWIALIVAVTIVICSLVVIAQFASAAPSSSLSAADKQATANANVNASQDAAATATAGSDVLTRVADNQTASASQPTSVPSPTATQPLSDIGLTQQSGDWSVTLNSVQTSYGDGAYTPKPGDTFLLLNLTAKNTGASNATMSDAYFSLRDSGGNVYGYGADSNVQDISGDVVVGQQIRGDVIFEIAKSVHTFTLQFDGAFDASQIVQWNISI